MSDLKNALIAGALRLASKKEIINDMNVFPVPDGDTGSNMTMTAEAAMAAMKSCGDTVPEIANAFVTGSLRGARGNSGVILSQLLRGFGNSIKNVTDVSMADVAVASKCAVETAYKAVSQPKEGTILSVAKALSEKASESILLSLPDFCEEVLDYGYEALAYTPEQLPILKEAGVVDSGGQGLMEFIQGVVDYVLTGEMPQYHGVETSASGETSSKPVSASGSENISTAEIKFGYCTEMIVNSEKPITEKQEQELKSYLESMGDSVVCVAYDDIIKVHVHTNHPGLIFEKGLEYGFLSNLKVDNMRLEHTERVIHAQDKAAMASKAEPKEYGLVAVSMGDGLNKIFSHLGVDWVIPGGQTMNPSAQDILNAIAKVNAKNIFVFPNNKNIILAANQAATMGETNKNITVIPTENMSQGIAAAMAFDTTTPFEANVDHMKEAMAHVKCGQVTHAVRTTTIMGEAIHQGDYMGIYDDGVVANASITQTVFDMVERMVDEDSEIITVYYGADVDSDQAVRLTEILADRYEDCDVEVYQGEQPIYYYIISVE